MLSGCQTAPNLKATPVAPPVQYMQHCHVPALSGDTNGHVVQYAASLKQALKLCNADKSALRAWAEDLTK